MAPSPGPRFARLVVLLFVVVLTTGLATSVVSAGSLPPCRVADVVTAKRTYADWKTTLLDTTYKLSSAYGPRDLRSTADAGLNSGGKVRALVVTDLRAMTRAARAAGARLAVQSAYRSYSTQASTFSYWVRVSGYSSAIKSSARAGHSEHQLGTTLDFRSWGGSAPWYYADWGRTRAGTWLRNNAWRYGFVMSYPKGKTSVTCYAYEPWHFRYVGRPMAAAIRASGLTLREYLWKLQLPTPAPPTPSPTPVTTPLPSQSAGPSPSPDRPPSPSPLPTPQATPVATPVATPTPIEPTPNVVPADPTLETPAPAA
jgi:D-alanyl-D-alanine carboxypeptidase